MPEGPECHVIGRRLHNKLAGKRILEFNVHGGRYKTHGDPGGWSELEEAITNTEAYIEGVGVKGKLIYWQLSCGLVVLNTLGMSGSWRNKYEKHCDVELVYDGGRSLWFRDMRHYGTLKVVYSHELAGELRKRGPDILAPGGVDVTTFMDLCRKYKHWTLPKLLMNQSKISGVGNYMKAEILYAARVNPLKKICDLNESKLTDVHREMHIIGIAALEKKGVSIRDHGLPDGSSGNYQFMLKVYGKKKDPLGNPVQKVLTSDNRNTHWVPEVQS